MGAPIVVLDTNVLISAFLWSGTPSKILQSIEENNVILAVSDKQFDEFKRVIGYEKFALPPQRQEEYIEKLLQFCTRIHPQVIVRAVNDKSDDAILEAAFQARASFIITGDNHLLRLRRFTTTPIVTPSQFMALLKEPF